MTRRSEGEVVRRWLDGLIYGVIVMVGLFRPVTALYENTRYKNRGFSFVLGLVTSLGLLVERGESERTTR